MKFRTIQILFVVLLLAACKKSSEKSYMSGSVSIGHDMPEYVAPGDVFSFTASGITPPDAYDVRYYFTNPFTSVKDTLSSSSEEFTLAIPDTLGNFSVSCVAFPVGGTDKYYTSSSYVSFTVVSDNPSNPSITGIEPRSDEEQHDLHGKYYTAFQAGSKEWMRSNLAYVETDGQGKETFGHSYADSPAMLNIFGAYYTWEEAQRACPAGWHLPSESEWTELLKLAGAPVGLQPLQTSPSGAGRMMASARFNGETLWDFYRDVKISDDFLSALPLGYATVRSGVYSFSGGLDYAAFWTSDEYQGQGVYRYIYKESDKVFVGTADKTGFAASVRCIN